jgi:hypothetical protein
MFARRNASKTHHAGRVYPPTRNYLPVSVLMGTLLLTLMTPLYSQLDRGSITGTVADTTGAVVPSVQVVIRNNETAATYRIVTTDAGQYRMPNLPIGSYSVVIEAPGFKKLIRSGIALNVAEVRQVDLVLEVGEVTETVEVTAEAVRLQTQTPEVGTTMSSLDLTSLPLSFSGSRTAENIAFAVTPGVTGGGWTSSINGSTAFSRETLIDGASATLERSGHFSEGSASMEAYEEFRVQTSGLSAEYGRTQTSVFNYVMKSGKNEIHGSAYGEIRNEALMANTFVNNARGLPRPSDRQTAYAFSFGGPVYIPKVYNGRDRTFFYATVERYKQHLFDFGAPNTTVPIPAFYNGDFSRLLGSATGYTDSLENPVLQGAIYDPNSFYRLPNGNWAGLMFPGNQIPVSRFSAVAQKVNAIMKQHYLPTVRDESGDFALVDNSVSPSGNESRQNQLSLKLDQNIGSTHKLAGSYSRNYRPNDLKNLAGPWDANDPIGGPFSSVAFQGLKHQFVRTAHDWIVTPSLLNHALIYVNRFDNPFQSKHGDINGGQALGISNLSVAGYPRINWGSGPFITLNGIGQQEYWLNAITTWGVTNTASYTVGRHFIKAGFDFRSILDNLRQTPAATFNFAARATAIPNAAFAGNLTGYSFASYLLGIVDNMTLTDSVPIGGRQRAYALFIQDDFKVNRKLTLNLGLRWDFQPPYFEAGNRISSWSPNVVDPVSGLLGAYEFVGSCSGCTGKRHFGTRDYTAFGPRIGFAYQPFDEWTIRGSYGILYEGATFNYYPNALGKGMMVPWGGTWAGSADAVEPWRGIFNWDGGLPQNLYVPATFDRSWGNMNRPVMIDPDFGRTPRIQTWNLNIQRKLVANLVLDVGYVGTKGTGLYAGALKNLNQLAPSVLSQYGTKLNNPVRNAADAAANGIPYPYAGFVGTVASALRPFPQVRGNDTIQVFQAPLGFSTYHSFQATVNRQFGSGLTVYANYVWSKSLTNVSSSDPTENHGPLNYYDLSLEKSLSTTDIPHMFKAYVSYELPFGRGKALWTGAGKAVNTLVGGWAVSSILNYYSGTPLGFSASSPLSGGWNGGANRANIAAGEMRVSSFKKENFSLDVPASPNNTYLNKSLFSDAPPLTLGTSAYRYGQARRIGTISENIGLLKNHRIGERMRIQLRAELLNAFNRHQLGSPNTTVTSPLFGQVTSVSGNRSIQIGARMDF